jgi:EAL domain-containing protein (putative c-di-GMP-specific phosphodiesterase class I)
MSDDEHCSNIVELIERSNMDPALVSIELAESVIVNNEVAAKKQLDHLRSLDFSISIDGFGTSFSSLGYLKKTSL